MPLRAVSLGRRIPARRRVPYVLKESCRLLARGARPVIFAEMSLSKAAPEDMPTGYFVGVRVSERRQAVGGHGREEA